MKLLGFFRLVHPKIVQNFPSWKEEGGRNSKIFQIDDFFFALISKIWGEIQFFKFLIRYMGCGNFCSFSNPPLNESYYLVKSRVISLMVWCGNRHNDNKFVYKYGKQLKRSWRHTCNYRIEFHDKGTSYKP